MLYNVHLHTDLHGQQFNNPTIVTIAGPDTLFVAFSTKRIH